jgi:hypothetical protein
MRPLRLTDDRGDDCASHRIVRIVASRIAHVRIVRIVRAHRRARQHRRRERSAVIRNSA